MSSKRQLILDTAKTLFISQGISGTTIANIAEKAGIAKGSVYSYFDSKLGIIRALLVQSLDESQAVAHDLLASSKNTGRALLGEYVRVELEQVLKERSFQQSIISDSSLVMDDETMAFWKSARKSQHQAQRTLFALAYGEDIENWQDDLITILKGITQEYSVYLTIDNVNFSIEHCAEIVAFNIDCMVNNLKNANLKPVLSSELLPGFLTNNESERLERALAIIEEIREMTADYKENERKIISETLSLIKDQLQGNEPNMTLIRALIANLSPYGEITIKRSLLADVIDVELI